MLQPYQCLLYCSSSGNQKRDILLAASGCYILSFDVQTGSLLSTWPSSPKDASRETNVGDSDNVDSERQIKRQKISFSQEASNSDSADIVVENNLDVATNASKKAGPTANVVKLISTSDCKHVIAVTAEDKSIRIFELIDDGSLAQVSERYGLRVEVYLRILLKPFTGQCPRGPAP